MLAGTAIALVLAGTFLGVSRHGHPLLPRARELFIPGGLILLVIAFRSMRREPIAAFWIGLVALALIGVGAHAAAHSPDPGRKLGELAVQPVAPDRASRVGRVSQRDLQVQDRGAVDRLQRIDVEARRGIDSDDRDAM